MRQASLPTRSIKAWKRSSTKPAAGIGQALKRPATNSAKSIPSSRQVSRVTFGQALAAAPASPVAAGSLCTEVTILLPSIPYPPSSLQLAQNTRIGDLGIVGQQERLAEDDRQHAVTFKRQEDAARLLGHAPAGNDAQELIVRLHEDIAAAEMN